MTKLKMKNCNMITANKLQMYQYYQQLKMINMNILQARKYYHLIKVAL